MPKPRETPKPARNGVHGRPGDVRDFIRLLERLAREALQFVPRQRVEATVRQWLTRSTAPVEDAGTVLQAAGLASFLALFSPSASGATAIDRLARHRSSLTPDEQAAITALRRSRFRVLRVEAQEAERRFTLCDLASNETLQVQDARLTARGIGLALAGRTAPLDLGTEVLIGPLIPLDAAGLEVARAHIRPNGKGLGNPERCAEALFRHAVRHGHQDLTELAPWLTGDDADGALPFGPEDSALNRLAFAWAEGSPGAAPSAEDIQRARELASIGALVDALAASAVARECRHERLAHSYARLAEIQIEVIQRRTLAGLAGPTLATVSAAIAQAIVAGDVPPTVRPLFEDLRRQVRFVAETHTAATDAEEQRLIQRIQGLRAKTVAQGCTEQEALAAAEKVGELLDRHGLSLSELELRRQTCHGVGIETGRRRTTALDDCVPDIAAFFDCRSWSQKLPSGVFSHVIFGLRGDVEAAQYLYALVDSAFATESALFAGGRFYRGLEAGGRRSATHSFQVGLGRGIREKLQALRLARENGLRSASGRDLVPLKASIVDHELDRLGLCFHSRTRAARRLVLAGAYAAGQAAGRRFEYRPGLAAAE
ncbi:MAG: DUF7168 domain-containing protein [Acetobacteraceae bacterium]